MTNCTLVEWTVGECRCKHGNRILLMAGREGGSGGGHGEAPSALERGGEGSKRDVHEKGRRGCPSE